MKQCQLFVPTIIILIIIAIGASNKVFAQDTKTFDVEAAVSLPVIDGQFEDWADISGMAIELTDAPAEADDFSVEFKSTWDSLNLYLMLNITDEKLVNGHEKPWHNDHVEIAIDGNADRNFNMFWEPQASDFKLLVSYGDDLQTIIDGAFNFEKRDTTGTEYKQQVTDNGWAFEIKLPFSAIAADIEFTTGSNIVIDFAAGDNDIGPEADKDSHVRWSGSENINDNASDFGMFTLKEHTPTAINDLVSPGLKVYPNPVRNKLAIETVDAVQSISIYNIKGSLVNVYKPEHQFENSISVSNLKSGVYILGVTNEKGKTAIKNFIKQ